jgi:hypothetical protein
VDWPDPSQDHQEEKVDPSYKRISIFAGCAGFLIAFFWALFAANTTLGAVIVGVIFGVFLWAFTLLYGRVAASFKKKE